MLGAGWSLTEEYALDFEQLLSESKGRADMFLLLFFGLKFKLIGDIGT